MIFLYKDPKGDTIFVKAALENLSYGRSSEKLDERDSEMDALKARVKELEDEAKRNKVSIEHTALL